MGRSPCCDKLGLKKGPWTPEEDQKLLSYIEKHGHGSWRALPDKAGLQRCGKSCRLRWTNYLRPDIKRGKFSLQEEQTIIQLHALLGNRWSAIATHLSKRTDNEIKNYWNTHLKKRLTKMGIDPVTHKPKIAALLSSDGQSKNAANLSHMAQWESARLEAEARLVRESKLRSQGISSSGSVSTPASASVSAVQRPWNCGRTGVGSGANGLNTNGIGDTLESPTSSLTFSENSIPTTSTGLVQNLIPVTEFNGTSGSSDTGLIKEECATWKGMSSSAINLHENSLSFKSCPLQDMTISTEVAVPWSPEEALRTNSNSHVHAMEEGFTSLLLSDSIDRNLLDGGKDSSDNEDNNNKNYWNSILNLIDSSPTNSSPTNSPIF